MLLSLCKCENCRILLCVFSFLTKRWVTKIKNVKRIESQKNVRVGDSLYKGIIFGLCELKFYLSSEYISMQLCEHFSVYSRFACYFFFTKETLVMLWSVCHFLHNVVNKLYTFSGENLLNSKISKMFLKFVVILIGLGNIFALFILIK